MMSGGYEWASTIEFPSIFEARMQKSELILDPQSHQVFKAILRKCLIISKQDTPFEKVSDLLLNLHNTKSIIELVLEDEEGHNLIDCELSLKPAYEYPPGRRKEEMVIKDFNH